MTPIIKELVTTFFEAYPLKTYNRDEIIARPGQSLPGIMYVEEGRAIQYDITNDGRQIVLNSFRKPAFFSMSNALLDLPNAYFFAAETKLRVRCAPYADVLSFLEKHPEVQFDLLKRVFQGTEGILRRLSYALGGRASTAIQFEVLIMARRFGTSDKNGCSVVVTHQQLAERTGLSRETVSRELELLQRRGLIELGYRSVVVPNIQRLEETLDLEVN